LRPWARGFWGSRWGSTASAGHERMYALDTETQTLIDSDGSELGLVATIDTGNATTRSQDRSVTWASRT